MIYDFDDIVIMCVYVSFIIILTEFATMCVLSCMYILPVIVKFRFIFTFSRPVSSSYYMLNNRCFTLPLLIVLTFLSFQILEKFGRVIK